LGSTLLSKAITGSNKAATCENARRAAVAAFHEAL